MMRMKALAAAVIALTLLGCTGNKVKIIPPDLEIVQLSGPGDQNYPAGEIEVQYGVRIANRSSEPIVLKQIQLTGIGQGGPYRLKSETYFFNRSIKPDGFEDVAFWAKAVATGDAFSIDAQAPVNVRGIAFFNSPSGSFRKVFTKTFNQSGGSNAPR